MQRTHTVSCKYDLLNGYLLSNFNQQIRLILLQATLQQFRVNELHILLSSFNCPKLGKKTELVHRCLNLLKNARNQAAVIQKIREIGSARRYNTLGGLPNLGHPVYNSIDGSSGALNGSGYNSSGLNLPSAIMQQQYISARTFPSQTDGTKNLVTVDLPFYDKQQTLLELCELAGNVSGVRTAAHLVFSFVVPANIRSQINYHSETTALPRTEIQLRFFLIDHSAEQPDDFPPNCNVKIDDVPVTLPNVIPTNKPNAEPKRPSRPVNITPYCQSSRDVLRPHRLSVEWTADKRSWAVGVYVVHRLTTDILLRRVVVNVNAHRDPEETRRVIKSRLSEDDDMIQMETLRISLLCPLGKTRMIIPAKASDCTHLQCFDLSNYLMMNERRPTWKCAVCSNAAPYKKLVIDGYFETVLKETMEDTTEVELLHDGSWRPIVENFETLSDDEDNITSSNVSKNPSQNARNGVSSSSNLPNSGVDDDVIVLDSDDDDEIPEIHQTTRSVRRLATPSVVCIDLDESDTLETPQLIHVPSLPSLSRNVSTSIDTASSSSVASVGHAVDVSGAHHHPVLHAQQQQQQAPQLPYFSNPAVPLARAHNTMLQGTSNANYFHPFEQHYPYFQQDYNSRMIAEELRQFMANMNYQSSSNQQQSNYPRYT